MTLQANTIPQTAESTMHSPYHTSRMRARRGYCAIGIYHPKKEVNVGGLWRTASGFGVSLVFTIGRRYVRQASDTTHVARHTPLLHYPTLEEFFALRPPGVLVGIEVDPHARPLQGFCHPPQAVYLLGAEDGGLPAAVRERCQALVEIPGPRYCLNVATAGSIVLWERWRSGK